ncbi:MAG: DUF11 domain-containing protein [Candidatus Caccovivens sp.]
MAFINRYSTIIRGGISFIGNTLGLSKASNSNTPGTEGSIGAFTSLGATQVNTFPVGTTSNYLQNGSNAILSLPALSNVLYAELVWGGLYKSSQNNISNLIDNAVTFSTPNSTTTVLPDATTAQTFSIPADDKELGFYVRTANVTELVASGMNGTYSVQGVPALIEAIDNTTNDTNHAGWTLCVVFGNANEPLRNLNLWVGGVVVGPNTPVTDTTLTGFITPPANPIFAKVFMSAQEGDAVLEGDQFLFGQNVGSLVAISGPNNPVDNFFASQINDENGVLDTTGTFGTRNANAQTGQNISAGRQGWDITAVDVSPQMTTSQTSAVFRFTSSGDLYVPNAIATQIDSLGAFLTTEKSVTQTFAQVGVPIDYTLEITNVGQLPATNVIVNDFLPIGLTLVSGSITVDAVAFPDNIPIVVPQIDAGQTITIKYQLIANSFPAQNPAENKAEITYTFTPFEGFPVTVTLLSNLVEIPFVTTSASLVKTVDKATAKQNDILTYKSVHTNTGTQEMQNAVFTDVMPSEVNFVAGSVKINGISAPNENPENGIAVGNLLPGQSVTIEFQAKVNTNQNTQINNTSNGNFLFVLPDQSTTPGTSLSNNVVTVVTNTPTPPTPIPPTTTKLHVVCIPMCDCDCHNNQIHQRRRCCNRQRQHSCRCIRIF